jgi:hypothetical protein
MIEAGAEVKPEADAVKVICPDGAAEIFSASAARKITARICFTF